MAIRRFVKRLFDIVASVLALALLSPVMLGVALTIYIRMGRPILFSQLRPGRHREIFTLQKFRSMESTVDSHGSRRSEEERLTRIGNFLRRTGLDELPQLWNVLKGDMSFVGPRPLLVRYLELYSPEQSRRHDVKPGVTGWAQVCGRRTLDEDWDEKFRLDVWYVDNWSLILDIKILWLTVVRLLRHDGIRQDAKTTSEAFRGRSKF